jgi:hypothetical protein
MSSGMAEVRRAAESDASLSLSALVHAYLWRLAVYVAAGALAGAWLARRVGRMGWRWAIPCGVVASALVFALTWVVTGPPWLPLAAPVIAGGLPAAAWRAWRRRGWRPALLAPVAWLTAALPAAALALSWW